MQLAGRARTKAAQGTRRDNTDTYEVDPHISKGNIGTSQLAAEDKCCLKMLQLGAAWTRDYLYRSGEAFWGIVYWAKVVQTIKLHYIRLVCISIPILKMNEILGFNISYE